MKRPSNNEVLKGLPGLAATLPEPSEKVVRSPSSSQRLELDGESPLSTTRSAVSSQWWFDARGIASPELFAAVEASNCTHIVMDHAQHKKLSSRKTIVVWIDSTEQLDDLHEAAWVFTSNEVLRATAVSRARKAGLLIQVRDLEAEFPYCIAVCERGDDFVVIDIEHATYIPYELLIAKTEGKSTRVIRSVPIKGLTHVVDDINQSLNAFATMEHGVGVLFRTSNIAAINNLSSRLRQRQASTSLLLPARVEEVQHTGLGHRVCVDSTSMMTSEEGMIIGSTGWGGIFVCSETHHLPHMNLREFRVNAGAVHSYIWGPNGSAMYLSELTAGAEVLCVNTRGESRVVSVGRAKIERRPMLKVRCSVALNSVPDELRTRVEDMFEMQERVTPKGERVGRDQRSISINTFLQNDWHVRVMAADGKVRHCTLLQPGDELLAHVDTPGRHTGLKVTESIVEN